MRKHLKIAIPIAGSLIGAWLLGSIGMVAIIFQNFWSVAGFLLAVGAVTGGFVWWWRAQLQDEADERNRRVAIANRPPAYVLPEDVEAVLDQHMQAVNAMLQAAQVSMDADRRLRARMQEMATYLGLVEQENEKLRAEAEKVQEIKQVAARTPRVAQPVRVNPDDYGIKKPKDELPAFLHRDVGAEIMTALQEDLTPRPTVTSTRTTPSADWGTDWPAAPALS